MSKSQKVFLILDILLFLVLGLVLFNLSFDEKLDLDDKLVVESLKIIKDDNEKYYDDKLYLKNLSDTELFTLILNTYDDELLNNYRFNSKEINKKLKELLDIKKRKIEITTLESTNVYNIRRENNIVIVTKTGKTTNDLIIKDLSAKKDSDKLVIEREVSGSKYNVIFIKDDKNYKFSTIEKIKESK